MIISVEPTGRQVRDGRQMEDGVQETILSLVAVSKSFGAAKAVDRLTLDLKQGEVFTLLGPSGCGKTTTLRQIAGLEHPDQGEIRFAGTVLAAPAKKIFVPPHKRQMGMVFQSYAIWPHLSVFETVAYPLRARKIAPREVRERVTKVLDLVGLTGLGDRQGPALSGGQQQRVALARALVYEPKLLLLDEPFSNLDVKLREQMRVEVKRLQRRIGVTILLVTHDQIEALSLSDRIAVMNQGKAEQIGTPQDLYQRPATPFVRDFIGKSITLRTHLESTQGRNHATVVIPGDPVQRLVSHCNYVPEGQPGQQVVVAIRPEDVVVNPAGKPQETNDLTGRIETLLFIGDRYECQVRMGDDLLMVYAPRNQPLQEGQSVQLRFPAEAVSVWPR
jgi:ABC-type Fe3+/spermidine/putrescine transport system ATPase subunit